MSDRKVQESLGAQSKAKSLSPSTEKPVSVTAPVKTSGFPTGPRNDTVQPTRSSDDVDNDYSMLYENDGQWQLDKGPVNRTVKKQAKVEVVVEGGAIVADGYNDNDTLNGGPSTTGGVGTVDPALAAIDGSCGGSDDIPSDEGVEKTTQAIVAPTAKPQ